MNGNEKFNIIIPPQDVATMPGCLEALARGCRQSYEWLYKNYSGKVYDYALLITANKALSEDIVQEVFIKIWKKKNQLIGIENFNAWLNIITRHQTVDILRKQSTERQHLQAYALTRPTQTTETEESPVEKYKPVIQQAIDQLTPKRRLVYQMIREQHYKRKEVAEVLQLSPCTVKEHMQQALRCITEYVTPKVKDVIKADPYFKQS